ncbi:unnamed protein product [Bemisia tabaci]|uniref:Breast cancer type 2 susceptibility protein n=1 Tax=Bemisia tabaci TaxID=7038 RepID=A0A9P0A7H7_BEMTA|nr:unnamed protein product [Bemisia tabaci]
MGFSTASGKKVPVSEDSLSKARQLLETCDNITPVRPNSAVGFSTASGRKVPVSEDSLSKARQLFESDKSTPITPNSLMGFSTASGKKVSVSDDAVLKAKLFLDSTDNSSSDTSIPPMKFSVTGGKEIVASSIEKQVASNKPERSFGCSKKNLNNRNSLLYHDSLSRREDTEQTPHKRCKIDQNFDRTEPFIKNTKSTSGTFVKSNFRGMEGKFKECLSEAENKKQTPMKRNFALKDSSNSHQSLNMSNVSPSIAREVSESAAALMNDEENSESGTDWSSSIVKSANVSNQVSCFESFFSCENDDDDGSTSPILISEHSKRRKRTKRLDAVKQKTLSSMGMSPSIPLGSSPFLTPGSSGVHQIVADVPRSLLFKKGVQCYSTPKMDGPRKRERETDVCAPFNKRLKECGEPREDSCEKGVLDARLKAAEEQEKVIRIRKKVKVPQEIGSYLRKKMTEKRILLRHAVLQQQPKIFSKEDLQLHGVTENVRQVTAENALNFRFSAQDHYSDEVTKNNCEGIEVGDGAKIVLAEDGTAGLKEIRRAFLSSPGVDTAIVPEKWVDNHYRWIVWKLACMEQRFPQIYAKKCLTMDNLLFQLKYRYDREIDRAQRSSLRKILESDEAASRRMILCVSKVTQSSSTTELELTDGWYSVKSFVDSAMASLLQRKKIVVGTKLMIQGAELLNCEQGCDPLEVRGNISLKIHSNCTRRAKWDAKMGFFHDSGPIPVRLDSVLCGGGVVGKLHVFIARVYPVLYLSKGANGKSVFLNEKLEISQRTSEDREKSKRMEAMFNEVKKELEEESRKKTRSSRRSYSKRQISSLSSGPELAEYLEAALDPSIIQFSEEQLRTLSEYKRMEEEKMVQELRSRVNERLKNEENTRKSSTPLLKVRIVEGSASHSNSRSSAILTVWRPPEDVSLLLKEGSFMNIYNVLPSSSRYGDDISLSTSFHTRYELVSKDMNHPLCREVSHFAEISNPKFGEVDVVGIVIHIESGLLGKVLFTKPIYQIYKKIFWLFLSVIVFRTLAGVML